MKESERTIKVALNKVLTNVTLSNYNLVVSRDPANLLHTIVLFDVMPEKDIKLIAVGSLKSLKGLCDLKINISKGKILIMDWHMNLCNVLNFMSTPIQSGSCIDIEKEVVFKLCATNPVYEPFRNRLKSIFHSLAKFKDYYNDHITDTHGPWYNCCWDLFNNMRKSLHDIVKKVYFVNMNAVSGISNMIAILDSTEKLLKEYETSGNYEIREKLLATFMRWNSFPEVFVEEPVLRNLIQ